MPSVNIPFIAKTNKNVDEIETSGSAVDVHDCYFDELGFARRRPGLELFTTVTGAGRIDGLFYWQEKLVTIAVSGGIVYSVDRFGTATTLGSGLLASSPVSFATAKISGNNVLAMANGNGVYTTDNASVSAQAQSPTTADHVAFIDRYLLANKANSGIFYWSDLNDPTTWNALNFAEAERKPDDVVAIKVQGRDIVIFGQRSIEFYYDDGVTPFARFEGGEVENGCSAPDAIEFVSELNSWFFFNENRHFIRMNNRTPQKVSGQYDDEIQDLTSISDCKSMLCQVGGRGWIILNFPTDNKTFVYDYQMDTWYRWGNWNSSNSNYDKFIGYTLTYNPDQNYHLVGDINNGNLYLMKNDIYTDNTQEIRSNIRTGFINHGTQNLKKSRKVQFRIKRGVAKDQSDTPGAVHIRFRDDNTGDFGNITSISTGIGGDSRFNTELYLGGVYRSRQWDITSSDNTPFIIGGFSEDIQVLPR